MGKTNRVTPLPDPSQRKSSGQRSSIGSAAGEQTTPETDIDAEPSPASPQAANNAEEAAKVATKRKTSVPAKPKIPSPFHFGLHEVIMPPDADIPPPPPSRKPITKPTHPAMRKTAGTSKSNTSKPMVHTGPAKKRRKSQVKTITPREYAQLALKQQEQEAAEEMAKFQAAKARVERRHTYGTHVEDKIFHIVHDHHDPDHDQNNRRHSQGSAETHKPAGPSTGAAHHERRRSSQPHPPSHIVHTTRRSTNFKHKNVGVPDENTKRRELYKEIDRRLGITDSKKVSENVQQDRVIMVDDEWVKNPDAASLSNTEILATESQDNLESQATANKSKDQHKQISQKPDHTVISMVPSQKSTIARQATSKRGSATLRNLVKKSGSLWTQTPGLLDSRIIKPKPKAPDISLPELIKRSESKMAPGYGPAPESTYLQETYDKAKMLQASGVLLSLKKGKSSTKSLSKQKRKVGPIPEIRVDAPEPVLMASDDATDPSKRKPKSPPSSPPLQPSKESLWKKLSTERIRREIILPQQRAHIRAVFDPRRKWKQAYRGVKENLRLEKLKRDREYLDRESSSSPSPEHEAETETEAAVEETQVKKRGCFGKILNFFKESDDSDQKRETVMEQKRRHQNLEKEELLKLRKHKRKLRKKAKDNITKTIAKAALEESVLTLISRIVSQRHQPDNHQLGLAMAKEGGEASGAADPLALTNIKNSTSYREFAKTAHGALPSRKVEENPTANLFASLLPILKQKNKNTDVSTKDTEEADAAVQKFRSTVHPTPTDKPFNPKAVSSEPRVNAKVDLRTLPGNISQKRNVKQERDKAQKEGRSDSAPGGCSNCMGNSQMMLRRAWRDFVLFCEIWHADIHRIDGSYGVGCSTYFRWLRQVVILNALYVLVSFSFLLIPEIAVAPKVKNATKITFHFTDIFIAEGVVGKSRMFYGAYQFYDDKKSHFRNTGFRFIFVVIVIFFLNSLYIGSRVREYYHHTIAKVTEREQNGDLDLFAKVLCSWDFNIINKDSAYAQHRSIARDFTDELEMYQVKTDTETTKKQKLMSGFKWMGTNGPFIMHQIINILVIIFVCGFGGLMYFFLSHRVKNIVWEYTYEIFAVKHAVFNCFFFG